MDAVTPAARRLHPLPAADLKHTAAESDFCVARSCTETSTHLGVKDGGVGDADLGARDVGAEQRQRDERGGADAEALADGGGGVAGGVQRVGARADVLAHARHLGDAARVVGDRAVRVDGQACGRASTGSRCSQKAS